MHRLIDPEEQVERHVDERLGYVTTRRLRDELDETARRDLPASDRIRLTLDFHRANIGDTGDAAYQLRLSVPSSDSAWAMTTAVTAYMPGAGRVDGGLLWTSEARTAGTATLRVRITVGGVATNYDLPACVLNATNTQTIGQLLPASTIRFPKGATLEARVVTAGTWGPTTADASARLLISFDPL